MREIDEKLIEKAALDDMDAFEEIYKVFSPIVYSVALNITRNAQDAEETTQDVFVKVFRKLKDFKFESSFGTWIYRIAANTAINIYNSRSRQRQKMDTTGEIDLLAIPDQGNSKDALEQKAAEAKVNDMLKALSEEHRLCIVLREIEGLDYKEMAEVLRIPLNTVRSRLKRAREALISYRRKGGVGYGL